MRDTLILTKQEDIKEVLHRFIKSLDDIDLKSITTTINTCTDTRTINIEYVEKL